MGKRVSRKKPVILIKSGVGGVGSVAAATMSQTASLDRSFEAFKACCEQAGLYLIEAFTEDPKILINIVSILTTQPRSKGNRTAVVGVGGGAAILLADFAPETQDRLAKLLGGKIRTYSAEEEQKVADSVSANPVDLFGDWDDERLLESLRILNDDPNTDMIVAAVFFQVPYLTESVTERLADLRHEFTKPVVFSPRGYSKHVRRSRVDLGRRGYPPYTVPMMKPVAIAQEIWGTYGKDFLA